MELFENEASALKELSHPHIIKLISADMKAMVKHPSMGKQEAQVLVTPFH